MKKTLWQYIVELYNDVPLGLYEGLVSVLCIGLVVALVKYSKNRSWRIISGVCLVEYVFLIYCATVIFRPHWYEQKFNLTPFWSYVAIVNGDGDLLHENAMNVAVFLPVGLFLGMSFKKIKLLGVALIAFCISTSIEALQFFFWKGFAELDDVIHNTLGCIIGYGIFKAIEYGIRSCTRKKEGYI